MDCEGMQTKIALLLRQKKYQETEDKIYEFLEYLLNKKNVSGLEKHYFWNCYIKLANCERRKDKYETAIEMAKRALKYCTNETEEHECYWIMGICYKYLGKTSVALSYYNKCIDFYCRHEQKERLVKVLKCKALLLHDEQLLQDAIDLIKKELIKSDSNIDICMYEDFVDTLRQMKVYNSNSKSDNISNLIDLDTYRALSNKTSK